MSPRKQPPLGGDGSDFDKAAAHPDVESAAEAYQDVKLKRVKLFEQEKAARKTLHDLMRSHGLTVYETDDLEIELVAAEEKVKVRAKKEKDDGA